MTNGEREAANLILDAVIITEGGATVADWTKLAKGVVHLRSAMNENRTKLEPIPYDGDVMTVTDFRESCLGDCFLNDDGIGFFATATEMSNRAALPSEIVRDGWSEKLDPKFTHVVWFNK